MRLAVNLNTSSMLTGNQFDVFYWLATAVLGLRQLVTSLSLWRPGFVPWSVHMGFVLNKLALGHCIKL
jgi:hypothetical protein